MDENTKQYPTQDDMPRTAHIQRKTAETAIRLDLSLDGTGAGARRTGIPFFDHMLDQLARHSLFDLTLEAEGDTEIDDHHTVEDSGIVLGQALARAIGDKRGIRRYGHAIVPMDEALALAAVDISGRGMLEFEAVVPSAKVGTFDSELVAEFLRAFASNAGVTLHIRLLAGRNTHHIIEGIFKALSQALRMAVAIDPRRQGEMPSTKGTLD